MGDLNAIVGRLKAQLGAPVGPPAPLDGGITNRNYRVGFGGREYVLRLPGKDTGLLGISREAERRANEVAAGLGIAPAVAAADAEYLVTDFVPGRAMASADVRAAIEPIARALRRFHDSGTQLPATFWIPDLLDEYARIAGPDLPAGYEDTRRLSQRIAAALPLRDPVPCHNDLLPANLLRLDDGGVMLVDWEYAGMGHRMFDLGNVAVNNEFGEDDEERLLRAYYERAPSSAERASLRLMRIVSDAREAAWGVLQSVISELEFDFNAYGREHFDRLVEAARDPRLEEWLDAATA